MRSITRAFRIFRKKKRCVYACFRFDHVSTGMREVEAYLSSKGISFRRLADPDPDFINPDPGIFYREGNFITILEVRGELGRVFYIFSTGEIFDVEDLMKPEFAIGFEVGSEEGLEALLRMIVEKRISGARHKHRSLVNFIISFIGSMVLSALMGFESGIVQSVIVGVMAFILFMIVDYPFSVLYLKGVKVIPVPKPGGRIMVVRIKRAGEKSV